MKKIIIVFLGFILFYFFNPVLACAYEDKIYCNATIDDDFKNDALVMVLRNSEVDIEELLKPIEGYDAEDISIGQEDSKEFKRIIYLTFEKKDKKNILSMINILEKKEEVYYVGPDYIAKEMSVAYDDFGRTQQWNLSAIDIPDAWEVSQGDGNVLVGILDTGIQANHPELEGRVNEGLSRDFTSGSEQIGGLTDSNGHGTHVAGIIGAIPNNTSSLGSNSGIAGICWNVSLVSLKVMGNTCYASNVIKAIKYADKNGIRILNFSGGFSDNNIPFDLYTAIQSYSGIMVMAAGNEGVNINASQFPNHTSYCNFNNVIVVGSSDEDNNKSLTSNYGSEVVDVFAPGTNILSLDASEVRTAADVGFQVNLCKKLGGTSQAAPHVTGLAALIMSAYPYLAPFEIKKLITHGVSTLEDFEIYCKYGGVINANTSLRSFVLLNPEMNNDVSDSVIDNKLCAAFYTEKSGILKININGKNVGNSVELNQVIYELADEDGKSEVIRSADDNATKTKEIYVFASEPGYYCLFLDFSNTIIDEVQINISSIEEENQEINSFMFETNRNETILLQTNIFEDNKVYKLQILHASQYCFDYEILNDMSSLINIIVFGKIDNEINVIYDNVISEIGTYHLDINALPGDYYICCFGLIQSDDIEMTLERVLTNYGESAIVSDPDYSTPSGSQINLLEQNNSDKSYRGTHITEGFTRILYLNEAIAPSTSRLDYYWYTNNENVSNITAYGTLLALPVNTDTIIRVMAVYKDDLSEVFVKEFIIKEDIGNNMITITLNMNVEIGETESINLNSVNVPINILQHYTWISNNEDVIVDKYGNVSVDNDFVGASASISGNYKYNNRVNILININIE